MKVEVNRVWTWYFGFSAAVAFFSFGIAVFSGADIVVSLKIGLFFGLGSLGTTSPILCCIEEWRGINLHVSSDQKRNGLEL